MKHLQNFIKEAEKKPTWGLKELRQELHKVVQLEAQDKARKTNKIQKLQKYDLVYMSIYGGVPHYILVEKVLQNKVFGIILSSTEGVHNLKPIEKDRILSGGWFSNSYCILDLPTALEKFIRVYENKSEANQVFRMVKQTYNGLFLGRNRQVSKRPKPLQRQRKQTQTISGALQQIQ